MNSAAYEHMNEINVLRLYMKTSNKYSLSVKTEETGDIRETGAENVLDYQFQSLSLSIDQLIDSSPVQHNKPTIFISSDFNSFLHTRYSTKPTFSSRSHTNTFQVTEIIDNDIITSVRTCSLLLRQLQVSNLK